MTKTPTLEQVQKTKIQEATIFVIDDSSENTEDIKDYFQEINPEINIQGVKVPKDGAIQDVQANIFGDFSGLITKLFYQNYKGILVDIDLRRFVYPPYGEIRNGIDIVKQLLRAKLSTPIAVYSRALEDYEKELTELSEKVFIFKKEDRKKEFIKRLREFYDLIQESEDSIEDVTSYQDFLEFSSHLQRSAIYNQLDAFNPDAYFEMVGDYTWCIKTSCIRKDYHGEPFIDHTHGLSAEQKQLKKLYQIHSYRDFKSDSIKEIATSPTDNFPFIYWNFRTLSLLKAQLLYLFKGMKISTNGVWQKIFYIQAGRKLARFYFDGNKKIRELVLELISKLNSEGEFEFQKEYIRINRNMRSNAQNPISELLDDFIKYNTLKNTITDFFIGEVQELEKETDTAWVILKHINKPSISYKEPMSYSYLQKRGIYGEGARFEYVLYQDERYNETVEITKI